MGKFLQVWTGFMLRTTVGSFSPSKIFPFVSFCSLSLNSLISIFFLLKMFRFSFFLITRLLSINPIRKFKCVPDVWALSEWSNWLTPAHLPRRYDTMFYIAFLDEEPLALHDDKEMTHSKVIYTWDLSANLSTHKLIWLNCLLT